MAGIIWSGGALLKLHLIDGYIRRFDPAAAGRMRDRLLDAGNSLGDFPNRGRPAADGARELVTVRPYILRYEVLDDDTVLILGIRHSAQLPDPG